MKKMVPRFKKERSANIALLIGKIFTAGIVTTLTYLLVLILTGIEMKQETWFWYVGGTFAGLLAAKIKLMGKIDKKTNKWIMILSLVMMLIAFNVLKNSEDITLLAIMAMLAGIPTYTNIKYTFKDQEEELKEHYSNNDYNSYNL